MTCKKCRKEILDGSRYCNYCGKKQTVEKAPVRRRSHGAGSVSKDPRNRKQWRAYAPADCYGRNRIYIGSFYTKHEAQDALQEFINQDRPDLYNATFGEVFDLWTKDHFDEVSEGLKKAYTSMGKHLDGIRPLKMREIRTPKLQEVLDRESAYGSARLLKTMLTQVYNYAMKNDIVKKNYAEYCKVKQKQGAGKRTFTKDEISLLWDHTDDPTVRIILFMIYTGLRIGEMTSLLKENVFLDKGYIIAGEKTEAGRNRIIPLPSEIPELKRFLTEWIGATKSETVLDGLTVQTLRNHFYATLDEVGIDRDGLTPHSTRHTFATLSASAGITPENLQKIIGHADYSTTAEVYIHPDVEKLIDEMRKLKRPDLTPTPNVTKADEEEIATWIDDEKITKLTDDKE